MFQYAPKLHHAIIAVLLCMACIAIGVSVPRQYAVVFDLGTVMFGVLFLLVVGWMVSDAINDRARVMIDFANAIANLDDEARAMMAFEFPTMQYHMKRGEVRAYFEGTNVPIELFREFLKTSNNKYISPRRDWSTRDKPEWAWLEIKEWLQANGKIVPDSAAGSHSWLWRGRSYEFMSQYWMAGRELRYDESDIFTQDATPPPLYETSSHG